MKQAKGEVKVREESLSTPAFPPRRHGATQKDTLTINVKKATPGSTSGSTVLFNR